MEGGLYTPHGGGSTCEHCDGLQVLLQLSPQAPLSALIAAARCCGVKHIVCHTPTFFSPTGPETPFLSCFQKGLWEVPTLGSCLGLEGAGSTAGIMAGSLAPSAPRASEDRSNRGSTGPGDELAVVAVVPATDSILIICGTLSVGPPCSCPHCWLIPV